MGGSDSSLAGGAAARPETSSGSGAAARAAFGGEAELAVQEWDFGVFTDVVSAARARNPEEAEVPLQRMAPTASQLVAGEAVIIWDWDDTLMCSSAITAREFTTQQARQLEGLLEQVLALSVRLGETHIVTNADEYWITASTRRFCPRVLPLLPKVSKCSARSKFEKSFPGDVDAWKREAFREIVASRAGRGPLNLVALGDSFTEMRATGSATADYAQPKSVKGVKFADRPSAEALLDELRVVTAALPEIVADPSSRCGGLLQWRLSISATAPRRLLGSLTPTAACCSGGLHCMPSSPVGVEVAMVPASGE